MNKDLDAVKRQAKDLRREEPRSAAEELGGFAGAARCIDKCRAALVGQEGEFIYGCPLDQQFLNAAGVGANELKQFVATGASDDQIGAWIREHSHAADAQR